MSLPKPESYTLEDVIKSIDRGDYRIPRFQRNYVWKTPEVMKLIDSLLHEFPIGSIILWETKNELSEIKNLGGIDIPKKDAGRYTSYVIDGQQRLTSLYFALKGLKTSTGTDCSELYVSLIADGDDPIVVKELPKGCDPYDYVLLKDLFNMTSMGAKHFDKKLKYYNTLKQYMISVIKIDDEKLGLDEVIEIFERLNLGGKKLNLFSIIAANSYIPASEDTPGFDLAYKYDLLIEEIKNKYGEIKDTTLLQVISACLIRKCNKTSILNDLVKVDIPKEYEKIKKALLMAMDHLSGDSYGVKIKTLLPYEAFLIVFSYFFYKSNQKILTKNQERYLCDYFWRSVITNSFGSASDTTINADLDKMDAILRNEQPKQDTIVFYDEHIVNNGSFSLTSAFSRGMLCLMLTKHPKSFAPGREIKIGVDALSNTSQKQYHHFFPKKCSAVKFIDSKRVNNVVNIIFMDALTNNQIDNDNPSHYIAAFENANAQLPSILKTHFIVKDQAGIVADDYETFLLSRSKEMYRALLAKLILSKHDKISLDDATESKKVIFRFSSKSLSNNIILCEQSSP